MVSTHFPLISGFCKKTDFFTNSLADFWPARLHGIIILHANDCLIPVYLLCIDVAAPAAIAISAAVAASFMSFCF